MMHREIRLEGSGGQGIITAGLLIGEAVSLREHKEAIMTESYSPYVRGGSSRADLIVSDEPIDYPLVTRPDILVAMSQEALDTNLEHTAKDATILVESGRVNASSLNGRRVVAVPALKLAEGLGRKVVANIVMLGVLTAETHIVGREAIESAIAERYPKETELNRRAFAQGYNLSSQGDPP
jgi:2-oxoglutarate ferredoxin oxidoreductase subunit gamma